MTTHPPESGAAAPLTLRTLGGAGLFAAGDAEPLFESGKPLAVLIYLALTPGRRISREFLMDLLWADVEPERARNALRQSLFHIRRVLGENALVGSEELALARPIDVDRDRFLAAIERGDLEAAVDLYGGDFLPGFAAPGGAAFERWADLERHRLRTAFLRSAELLVRRALNESRFRDGQRLARRVRDEAPEAEAAWRLLLEAVVAGRDFVAAAVEAQSLESWAVQEEITLEPATRAAIARARQVSAGATGSPADSALVAELTGREREFSAITTAWESARAGHARHLHLTAPAGLGKTRLLRDAVARLQAGGARVVETRGTPGDRDIPFAFAGDLAMAIAALPGAAGIAPASASTLIGLNPALSSRLAGVADSAVGEDALRRRVQALADLAQSVAYEQPFVLVVDDVHWLDVASYRVLEGLFTRLRGAHILCLTAARPERVPAGDTVSILPLFPLTPSQVASLVSAIGSVPAAAWSRDFVSGVHDATRGSPLLILETLRLAMDQGVLSLEDNEWKCSDASRLARLLRAAESLRRRVGALPTAQAWTLALLATAGTPLPLDALATALDLPTNDVANTLAGLERLGLVVCVEAGWIPAHDEIAEASRDVLEAADRSRAELAIGLLLVDADDADANRLLRGMRHIVAGGDDTLVRRHFGRYARHARDHRDRRPFADLAAEVLGDDPLSPRARSLAAALPATWRFGLWNAARRRAAVAAALTLVVGGAVTVRERIARSASLQRLVYADSARKTSAIAVDPSEWDGRNSLVTASSGSIELLDAALTFPEIPPAVSPDGRALAWTQDFGDSTTLDIWLRTPTGTRRLTNQPRDDLVQGWLPDGSALIGMTNRWSPPSQGNYDIAIFDTATGAARQITSGLDHDARPFVSPDGTRIAFVREERGSQSAVLCVTPFDGVGTPVCRLVGGHSLTQILGWSGLVELILTVDSAGARPLLRYDWERDKATSLLGPYVYLALLSPDRRWVLGARVTDGIRGFRDWIIPIDRPALARRVDRQNGGSPSVRWWEGPPDRSLVIDRIEFTDTARTILAGVGTKLGIRALTVTGTEIPVLAPLRWTSLDTSIATVDSTGVVRARRSGTVTVDASLAGWRHASKQLEVRAVTPRVVLDERWDASWERRWIAFGDPRPLVTSGPGGVRAMWNNGDGTFPSMVVLRRALSAKDGLGIEVRMSTQLTGDDWQRARTFLIPGYDTAALQRGDQKKAPASDGRIDGACGSAFPGSAGRHSGGNLGVVGGISTVVGLSAHDAPIATGAWWTLRIQLLPDGRCGVAINNRVVWLSTESIPLDGEFRVRLGDESAGTKILHGPLQVWMGVRTDIDWSKSEHELPARR